MEVECDGDADGCRSGDDSPVEPHRKHPLRESGLLSGGEAVNLRELIRLSFGSLDTEALGPAPVTTSRELVHRPAFAADAEDIMQLSLIRLDRRGWLESPPDAARQRLTE